MSADLFNRAIINNAFRRAPDGDQSGSAQDDIQLDVEEREASNFQIDPESIDAEFTTVKNAKKSKNRKLLFISLGAVAVFSSMFFALHFMMGPKEVVQTAIGPQGIPEPAAQTPATLNSLSSTVPSSLTPPEAKQESAPKESPSAVAEAVDGKPNVAASTPTAIPVTAPAAQMLPVANQAAPAPVLPTAALPASAPAPVLPVAAQQEPLPVTSKTSDTQQPRQMVEDAKSPDPQLKIASNVAEKPNNKPAEKTSSQAPVKQEKKAEEKKSSEKSTDKGETKQDKKTVEQKQPAKEKTTDKPANKATVSSEKPKAETQEAAAMESVKPLVSFSAGQLGVRSFSQDTLILLSSKTNSPVRYRVGDTLPSGDVIEHLDSNSMTVVTNLKVIRITN